MKYGATLNVNLMVQSVIIRFLDIGGVLCIRLILTSKQ